MSDRASSHLLPSIWVSIAPIVFLVFFLSVTVYVFGEDSTGGAVQVVLILSTAMAACLAATQGISWNELQEGIKKSIYTSLSAILVLLLIGALAGTWMISGVIPTIIYYGLELVHPVIFLFAACVTSAVVSLATGSSWSTIATIGIALLAIGKAMGMNEGMIAGAIISGAYFGDKLSPLSDTTNLASAVVGVSLFTHIRYMLYTTVPSIVITLLIFLGIGLLGDHSSYSEDNLRLIAEVLDQTFLISPLLLLVPLVVVLMVLRRVAAIPALLTGALLGGITALIVQPQLVAEIGGATQDTINTSTLFKGFMKSVYTSTHIQTGHTMVDNLLSTKGMEGMLNTIWLILCAIAFGGVMEAAGFLRRITTQIILLVKGDASLVVSTTATCLFFNTTTSDQYLAIIIPGKMFEKMYKNKGLRPELLSRTLEDSATVTSVLVPWNSCGATQANVLGVATLAYAPFCFFNIISPCMTLLYAFARLRLRHTQSEAKAITREDPKDATKA